MSTTYGVSFVEVVASMAEEIDLIMVLNHCSTFIAQPGEEGPALLLIMHINI